MARPKPSHRKRASSHRRRQRNKPAKSGAEPRRTHALKHHSEWERFLTFRFSVFLLVLVTVIAYVNAWPDSLAWDDARFALVDRFSGLGLADVASFFRQSVWAIEGINHGLYRPLLLASIMLDVKLFGSWVAGYHLVNILLHVSATVLVYGFIRHLLRISGDKSPLSSHMALLAALVFAVHPIHTEAVDSIFNRSEILVTIGVVGGLWWFLNIREKQPAKAWIGLSLVYLLVLFCRESGTTLPALTVALLCITVPGNLLVRIRKCIPVLLLLIPLAIYFALRANALGTIIVEPAVKHNLTQAPVVQKETNVLAAKPPAEAVDNPTKVTRHYSNLLKLFENLKNYDTGRLVRAVKLWAQSLKMILWPHPLMIFHRETAISFPIAAALQLLLLAAAFAGMMHGRIGLITGLAFFYIALLPSSGLIGVIPLGGVAERFLYLPSVGLTIVLAFGLNWLARRFSVRTAIAPVLILTLVLTPLTWARNSEWHSSLRLAEADYRHGMHSNSLLQGLVDANVDAGNYRRAVEICDKYAANPQASAYLSQASAYMRVGRVHLSNICGFAYGHVGRYDDAEKTLLDALQGRTKNLMIHFTLAGMYLHLGRRGDAQKQYEDAVAGANKPYMKEFLTGLMLSELYPSDRNKLLEAKAHFERVLELQPQYFPARQHLRQLNGKLAHLDGFTH